VVTCFRHKTTVHSCRWRQESYDTIGWFPVTQIIRPENDPDKDRIKRETASHAAHVLRRQSATGRSDERTARRDDRTQSESDQGLVPEQTVQGQEAVDIDEAASDAATTATAAAAPCRQCKARIVEFN